MHTPRKQLVDSNLYELPSCSICLSELFEEITALACGHCFHYTCISQHFEYKGTCPNCQKRAGAKELRSIRYTVVKNTKANAHLEQLLASLNLSEKKQVEELLGQIKNLSAKNEKMIGQIEENKKELRKKEEIVEGVKEEYETQRLELGEKLKMIVELNHMNRDKHDLIVSLEASIRSGEDRQANLQTKLKAYQRDQHLYDEFRNFKKIMNQNSKELVNYKQNIENQQINGEERARIFFEMLQMKSLECMRLKSQFEDFKENHSGSQAEIRKLTNGNQELKKIIKENSDRRLSERKKYDVLKDKYRAVLEKAKLKGVREFELQDSNNFTNIMQKTQPTPSVKSGLNLMASETQTQMKLELPKAAFKKPTFSSTSTFGGLKRK